MQEEAAQELIQGYGHQFLLIVVSRVPPAKGDVAVGQRDQSMVGDGDAMGVTAEIVEHILGAPEGWLGVDYPVFAKQRSQPGGEEFPASARVAPFPPRLFESLPHCAPRARRRCVHHSCHPAFSSEHENPSDRLLSSLLRLTQCEQMSGQARRARPCGRRSWSSRVCTDHGRRGKIRVRLMVARSLGSTEHLVHRCPVCACFISRGCCNKDVCCIQAT